MNKECICFILKYIKKIWVFPSSLFILYVFWIVDSLTSLPFFLLVDVFEYSLEFSLENYFNFSKFELRNYQSVIFELSLGNYLLFSLGQTTIIEFCLENYLNFSSFEKLLWRVFIPDTTSDIYIIYELFLYHRIAYF